MNEHIKSNFSNSIIGIQTTFNISLFEKIEGLPKVFLKVINLKNQGMYDKESDDIVTEICGESSFQERLS